MVRLARRDHDVRVAVSLVAAVAFVSIVTGIAAMVTAPILEAGGTVATLQTATGFSGVLVGFALLAAAWGMGRGFRLAHVAAAVLLVLSASHGIAQARLVSVPLVVLSIAVAALLVRRRRRREFTRSVSLTETQVGALLAIVGVLAYGTVGAYVLRTDLTGVDGLVDGLYFTLVTASTVGYGDVHATTGAGRLFAISLVLVGPATVAVAAGTLFGPLVESYLAHTGARVRNADRSGEGGRAVLLADPDLGERVVDSLAERASLSVVTADESWAATLEGRVADVSVGDPTDETLLDRLDLPGSGAVVVATDAGTTPYAVLAVRRLDSAVRVVAVVAGDHGADLAELGANATIDPDGLLARTTADAALDREADGVV